MTNKKGLLCVTSVGNYIIDLFNYRLEPLRGLNKCPKNTIYCMIETFHRSQGHFFVKYPQNVKYKSEESKKLFLKLLTSQKYELQNN